MGVQHVAATIARDSVRSDVAVAPGTSVADMLSMVDVDPRAVGLRITDAYGRSVSGHEVMGTDVLAGSVLTVSGLTATRGRLGSTTPEERAMLAADAAPTAAAATVLFVALLDVVVVIAPLAVPEAPSLFVRGLAAVLSLVAVLALVVRGRFVRSAVGALIVPLLLGVPVAVVVPPATGGAALITAGVVAVATAVAALALWLVTRTPVAATAAACWGVLAVCVSAAAFLGVDASVVAPVLLLVGVAGVLMAPDFALPIPESMLVNLPLLTTSAPAVRQPESRPPARITPRRVQSTISHGDEVSTCAAIGGVVVAALAAPFVAANVDLVSVRGISAAVALAAAVAVLALVPRLNRSPVVLIAPRIGAAVIAASTASGLALREQAPLAAIMVGVLALGFVLVWGALVSTREPRSAGLGRAADVVQGLALLVIVPASALAAGLFDLVRQVFS